MSRFRLLILASLAASSGASAAIATVDGMDIYWTSEGSGPAIIFVHGWTCDTTAWVDQMAALRDRYRVIALDLPGHGLSDSPQSGGLTIDTYASAVEAVRADAGVDNIVLVGHSMGVPVISRYAIAFPERVSGLIGIDGALVPSDLPVPEGDRPGPPSGSLRPFREQAVRGMFVPGTPTQVQDKVLHMMLGPSDVQAIAAGLSLGTFSIDEGQIIDDPTLLVLAGTAEDPDLERLAETVRNLEVERMDGTGHFLMMERPAEFNSMVTQFLGDIGF